MGTGGHQAAQRCPIALTYWPTATGHGGGCPVSWLVAPHFTTGQVITTEPPTRCWPLHPNLLTPCPQPNCTPDNNISPVKSCFLCRCMSNVPEELKRNTHSRPLESGAGDTSPPRPDPTTDAWAAKKHVGEQELSPAEKGIHPPLCSPRDLAPNMQPHRAEAAGRGKGGRSPARTALPDSHCSLPASWLCHQHRP